MRRSVRRRVILTLSAIAMALALVAVVLTRSDAGARLVVRLALPLLERALDGRVSVEDARTEGLLGGLTLVGIAVTDSDGAPAVALDSLSARYHLTDLIRGRIRIAGGHLWGGRIDITRMPGESRINLERIFDPAGGVPDTVAAGPDAAGKGSGVSVTIQDVHVHGTDLIVRIPAGGDGDTTRAVLEPAPDGGLLRRIEVLGIEADVDDAWLLGPGLEGESLEVSRLSADVRIFPSPFRLEDLAGSVRRVGSTVSLTDGRLQVGGSRLAGTLEVAWGGDAIEYEAHLDSDGFDPGDFAFFEPRLPSGRGRGHIDALSRAGRATFALADGLLAVGGSRIQGSATVHTEGEAVRLESVDLTLTTLDLDLLDPWAGDVAPIPLEVDGHVGLDGPLSRLAVAAQLTVASPENRFTPSRVQVDGGLRLTEPRGAIDLGVRADPLALALVAAFWPPLPLVGTARANGRLDGSFGGRLEVDMELAHLLDAGRTSQVRYVGWIDRRPDDLWLRGELTLDSLHLPSLESVNPVFANSESASGMVALDGPLGDLTVTADLATTAGDLSGTAHVDGHDPAAGYRIDARVRDLEPGRLVAGLDSTSVTGNVELDLAGVDPRTLTGTGEAHLGASRLYGLALDSADISVSFGEGYASVDSAVALVAGGRFTARGEVALADSLSPRDLDVTLDIPSLDTLWQRFAETSKASEADSTEASGPRGSLSGRGTLQVTGARVSGAGDAVLGEAAFDGLEADSVQVTFSGTDLFGVGRGVQLGADLTALHVFGRSFDRARADLEVGPEGIGFDLGVAQNERVEHRAIGRFVPSDTLRVLALDRLELRQDTLEARLLAPSTVTWGEAGMEVGRFELAVGRGPGRLVLDGRLPREGDVAFRAEADSVSLALLSKLLSVEDSVGGMLQGRLSVAGPASNPRGTLEGSVQSLSFRGSALPALSVTAEYRDRSTDLQVDARDNGTSVLSLKAVVPVDLAMGASGDRFLDAPLTGTISAHGFPVALLATLPGVVQDVGGSVTGDLTLSGAPRRPRAEGTLRIDGGSGYLPALGIRSQADGTLTLDGEGAVSVDVRLRSGGTARVTGTLDLGDVTRPGFDLTAVSDTFQALNRRDVAARVSGPLRLEGDWEEPRVSGSLAVSKASLMLDELAHSRQVADVAEADFYTVVDTTIFYREFGQEPSLVERAAIDLDLTLRQDSWLRSRDINAELEGSLEINHAPHGEYVLNGELRTVRGSYSGFGRTFQVVEGSVLFTGSRSFDPVLHVVTVTRVRSRNQALDIYATLQGTATAPEVHLSTNGESQMAEEELISYLVFGRPSYELGSGEGAVLNGVTGAASSMALGIVANELGTALGSSIGMFDYFNISAPQEVAQYGQGEALRSSISSTQVEFGQYLSNNLFIAAIFRPLDSSNQFAGGRLEWRFQSGTKLEVFLEDRLARSPSSTFGDLGFTLEQSLGMFLAKEWVY